MLMDRHIYHTQHFFPSVLSTTFVSIRSYFTLCECLILTLSSRVDMQTGDYAAVREPFREVRMELPLDSTQLDNLMLPNLINGKISARQEIDSRYRRTLKKLVHV